MLGRHKTAGTKVAQLSALQTAFPTAGSTSLLSSGLDFIMAAVSNTSNSPTPFDRTEVRLPFVSPGSAEFYASCVVVADDVRIFGVHLDSYISSGCSPL